MTWLAEVRHVLAKDVRQFRWMLTIYLAFVLAAMARGVGWAPLAVLGSGLGPIAVVLSGMIIIASIVQTDSPIRSNAFWATHPLRPSAMAGAKIGFGMLLLVLGLVAQAVAIGAYDLGRADVVYLLVATAATTLCWFIAAMVIGTMTRELPSFILTVIAIPVVGYTLVIAVMQLLRMNEDRAMSLPDPAGAGLRSLALLGGVGLVGWLYQRRDGRRRMRVVAAGVAALMLYTAALPFPSRGEALPLVAEDLSLTLELDDEAGQTGSEMQLRITGVAASGPVGRHFEPREFTLRLRSDSTVQLDPSMVAVFGGSFSLAPVPPLAGIRWIDHSAPPANSHAILIRLPATRNAVIASDVSAVTLAGRMIISEPRALARMPLRVGAEVINDGHRIRVDQWTPTAPRLPLTIAVSVVNMTAMQPVAGNNQENALSVALINERLGEGYILQLRGEGNAGDGLVLPGLPVETRQLRYERQSMSGASRTPAPDAEWLRHAEVMIFREVPVGAYPVRLESVAR